MPGLLRKNRDFVLLLSGQLAGQMGAKIHLFALSWYFVNVLNDNTGLVLMLLSGSVPMLVAAPFAGPIVDRFDKRLLMIVSEVAASLAALGIAAAVKVNAGLAWICVPVFCLGLAQTVFNPASRSLLPVLVGRERIQEAASLYTMVFNIAMFAGAAAGGVIVGFAGVLPAVLFNAAFFLISASSIALMDHSQTKAPPRGGYMSELRGGFAYISGRRRAMRLLAVFGVFNVFVVSMAVYLPVMIDDYLGMGASSFGLAESLFPLGSIAAAFLLAFLPSMDHLRWVRVCITMAGGAFLLTAFGRTYPFILATMTLLGFLFNAVNINAVSWFLKDVAGDFHGRFFSIHEQVVSGTFTLALLTAGMAIRNFDVFDILTVNGMLVVVLGLAGLVFRSVPLRPAPGGK